MAKTEGKGNPCYLVAESLENSFLVVTWNAENVLCELGDLAHEISKQRCLEGGIWFLLADYSKIGEEWIKLK